MKRSTPASFDWRQGERPSEKPRWRLRQAKNYRGVGTAVVTIALAGVAGTYTYRQFAVAPEAEFTAAPKSEFTAIPQAEKGAAAPDFIYPFVSYDQVEEKAGRPFPAQAPGPVGEVIPSRSRKEGGAGSRERLEPSVHVAAASNAREIVSESLDDLPSSDSVRSKAGPGEAISSRRGPEELAAPVRLASADIRQSPQLARAPKIVPQEPGFAEPEIGELAETVSSVPRDAVGIAEGTVSGNSTPGAASGDDLEPVPLEATYNHALARNDAEIGANAPVSHSNEARQEFAEPSLPAIPDPSDEQAATLRPADMTSRPAVARQSAPSAERKPDVGKEIAQASRPAEAVHIRDTVTRSSPRSRPRSVTASASDSYTQSFPMIVVNGERLGALTVREFGDGQRLIHLGALLSLFKARMEPAEYERLISAGTADQFVSLEQLRLAGLDARYNSRRGRLEVGLE